MPQHYSQIMTLSSSALSGFRRPKAGVVFAGQPSPRALAVTLIERLLVVAIIGVLTGMLLPALNRARHKADGAVCLNNLKQLQLAWQLYTDDHGGEYPENYSEWIGGVWRSSFNSWCGPSSAPHDTDTQPLTLGTFGRYGYLSSCVPTWPMRCLELCRRACRAVEMTGSENM